MSDSVRGKGGKADQLSSACIPAREPAAAEAGNIIHHEVHWRWPTRVRFSGVIWARYLYQSYLLITVTLVILVAPTLIFALVILIEGVSLTLAVDLVWRSGLLPDRIPELLAAVWRTISFPIYSFGAPLGELPGVALGAIILCTLAILGLYMVWRIYLAATEDRLTVVALIALFFWVYQIFYIMVHTPAGGVPEAVLRDPARLLDLLWLNLILLLAVIHLGCAIVTRGSRAVRAEARAPRFGLRALPTKYRLRLSALGRARAELIPLARSQIARASAVAAILVVPIGLWTVIVGGDPSPAIRVGFYKAVVGLAMLLCLYECWAIRGYRWWNAIFALLLLGQFAALDQPSAWAAAPPESPTLFIAAAIATKRWLFAPSRATAEILRRKLMESAAATLARSGRAPILLLRPFADDAVEVTVSHKSLRCAFGESNARRPLEDVIGKAVFARGPLVTVSDPRMTIAPSTGALRDSPDEDWRNYVIEKMEAAHLVICIVGLTPSFRWEVEQLLERGLTEKALFVLPPGYPRDRSIWAANSGLAALIGIGSAEAEQVLGEESRVFGYDREKRRWLSYDTMGSDERAYLNCLRAASQLAAGAPVRYRRAGSEGVALTGHGGESNAVGPPSRGGGHPLIATLICAALLLLPLAGFARGPRSAASPLLYLCGGVLAAAMLWGVAYAVTLRKASTEWKLGSLGALALVGVLAGLAALGSLGWATRNDLQQTVRQTSQFLAQEQAGRPPGRVAPGDGPLSRIGSAVLNAALADRRAFQREADVAGLPQLLSQEELTRTSPVLDRCDRLATLADRANFYGGRFPAYVAEARRIGEAAVLAGELPQRAVDGLAREARSWVPEYRRTWELHAAIITEAAAVCRVLARRRWTGSARAPEFEDLGDRREWEPRQASLQSHLARREAMESAMHARLEAEVEAAGPR